MNAIGNLVTAIMFAGLGFLLSRFLDSSRPTILVLLLGAVVGWWIGVKTLLFSAYGFAIRLNWAISACCLGLLAGLVMRRRHAPAH